LRDEDDGVAARGAAEGGSRGVGGGGEGDVAVEEFVEGGRA